MRLQSSLGCSLLSGNLEAGVGELRDLGREIVAVIAGGNKGRLCCFGIVGELHLHSCNFSFL